MAKWLVFILMLLGIGSGSAYFYYQNQFKDLPQVSVQKIQPQMLQGSKVLPFFELMSPIPTNSGVQFIPKLEYVRGPPSRYIEKISLIFFSSSPYKERITYYGRQTPDSGQAEWNTAAFFQSVVNWRSQVDQDFSGGFFARLYAAELAKKWLSNVARVLVLEQAGQSAFLLEYKESNRATMLFYRNNSVFRVNFSADKKFDWLDPRQIFSRSFLVRNRSDALEFSAKSLAAIKLDENQSRHFRLAELNWPMALLAVNLSLDPAAIDAYFHFAGINALLYKSTTNEQLDLELIDIVRNNIISASVYAKDIDSENPKTKEISALSRQILKSLEASSP